jgi:uncharacterized membrane protein
MTTPLLMLALMVGPYLGARLLGFALNREYDLRAAAVAGLALLFFFTGLGHFVETEAMAQMLPSWVPVRVAVVYLTGVLEWAIALGFLIPEARRSAGWMAIGVLIAFFPANIYAAVNFVPMGDHALGPVYLLVRAPLQLGIALWAYWFTVRRPRMERAALPVDAVTQH